MKDVKENTTDVLKDIFSTSSKKLFEKAREDRIYTIKNFVIYLKQELTRRMDVMITLKEQDIRLILDECEKAAIDKINKAKGFSS